MCRYLKSTGQPPLDDADDHDSYPLPVQQRRFGSKRSSSHASGSSWASPQFHAEDDLPGLAARYSLAMPRSMPTLQFEGGADVGASASAGARAQVSSPEPIVQPSLLLTGTTAHGYGGAS